MESIYDKIMEFERTGHCDVIYVKKKEQKMGKKSSGIKNIDIKDFQEKIIVYQRKVTKIWETYITDLYDRANRSENTVVGPEEGVDADEKFFYFEQCN